VIATESYEQFAENLQKEIEADTGIRFGIVEKHQFATISVTDTNGKTTPLGIDQSAAIWSVLKDAGYVDSKGKVQDHLRKALKDETLKLPDAFAAQLPQVKEILRKLAGRLDIKNADDRVQIKTRQAILHSEEFQAFGIGSSIGPRIEFILITKSWSPTARLQSGLPPITKTRVQIRKADLSIGEVVCLPPKQHKLPNHTG